MRLFLTTTGVVNAFVLSDLGDKTVKHPTIDWEITEEFTLEELRDSADFKKFFSEGWFSLKDENGRTFTLSDLEGGMYIFTVDGGDALSVYLPDQVIDGGDATS